MKPSIDENAKIGRQPGYVNRVTLLPFLLLIYLYTPTLMAQILPFDRVAQQTQVPQKLLYAISLVESGRVGPDGRLQPWPWTLNIEGTPRYYQTREAAWFALEAYIAVGITMVDIGLMQINWHYHKTRFETPWHALEPSINMTKAADILNDYYQTTGSWFVATGKYHAPSSPSLAFKYQKRVLAQLLRL